MAYLGTEKLIELIETEGVIGPDPNTNRIVCGAYEMSLGDEVFRTDSKEKTKEFLTQPKQQITINPGQFALLLTQEIVTIPKNKIAFISIKAGIKLKGLINVSGFHVDPGFRGKLIFSVYNAGSSPISLLRGEPCFLFWFAELDITDAETTSYSKESHEHKNQDTIPTRYIDALLAGELASPSVLLDRIKTNYAALESKINLNDETQKGKIGAIERDQKANNYIAVTALGLLIVLIVKFVFDWTMIRSEINRGLEIKRMELQVDSVINERLIEKQKLFKEIDSLQRIRPNFTRDTTR
jgi:dCTP deaminase